MESVRFKGFNTKNKGSLKVLNHVKLLIKILLKYTYDDSQISYIFAFKTLESDRPHLYIEYIYLRYLPQRKFKKIDFLPLG